MPPTLLPPESADTLPASLPTSRKWLVQATLLLGLLGLGRWMRHVPERLQASQLLPASPVSDFATGWHVPLAEPDHQVAATALTFSNPEP
jgi:hypothetical protein